MMMIKSMDLEQVLPHFMFVKEIGEMENSLDGVENLVEIVMF